MRCEGCTGDRCEDALDRCLELDNRCEGCRLTSGSVRILVEATDESEDEASNGGGCFGRLRRSPRCGGRFEDFECHNEEPPLSEGSDLTIRDPSDSGGLSGKAASEEEILEAFKVRRGRFGVFARGCRVAMLVARTAVR